MSPIKNKYMKVEALKHKNVRGKELLYLKISDEKTGEEVIIEIGQKTFDSVTALGKPKKKEANG